MIVKSIEEITDWLFDNGYIHDENGLTCKGKITFSYDMFSFCGLKKPDHFTCINEWLKDSPKDYLGKICSVWDGGKEPNISDRTYQRITDYYHSCLSRFGSNNSVWNYARAITADELDTV